MKGLHLLAVSAATAALLIFAASKADAQPRPVGGVPRNNLPSSGSGMHGGIGGVIVVEREVVHVVEREADAKPAVAEPVTAAVPAPPREPYVIGNSYSSLPSGCMKMIEVDASYYYCSGEWYRQVKGGNDAQYRAVAQP